MSVPSAFTQNNLQALRPDLLLIAYAINPSAIGGLLANIYGLIALGLIVLILIAIVGASVAYWLVTPYEASFYLILSSVVHAAFKKLIVLRHDKQSEIKQKTSISASEIILSIPMILSLVVACYLGIFAIISLIYTNRILLVSFIGLAVVLYLLKDYFTPWLSQTMSNKDKE